MTSGFAAAWHAEAVKLRRSMVARLMTPLLVVLIPGFAIGAVALARIPALPGAAAAKFAPYATGDLAATHLLVLGQLMSVAPLLAGGFAAAWTYGREFSDRTAGALFGLTARRGAIALAKALVLALWLTVCVTAAVAVTVAWSLAVGGRPGPEAWWRAGLAVSAGLLAVALTLPFAWAATITRSQLGTVGALIGVVMVTEIVVTLGGGAWFPYAVPSLLTETGGIEAAAAIGPGSTLATALVAPVGLAAVVWQWEHLDDV